MPNTSIKIKFKDSDFSNVSDLSALRTFIKNNIWTVCNIDDESTWTPSFLVNFSNSYFNDKVFRTEGTLNSDLSSAVDNATQVTTLTDILNTTYHILHISNTSITV